MPFSGTTSTHTTEYWDNHFQKFLKLLIEENPELEAHRSTPLRGDVLRRIITDLVTSPIVLADITDNNPNVLWELGVRQSFKHGTVTIIEHGNPIPFDLAIKATLRYYPQDQIKLEVFRADLKKALQDCLSNPDEPDSHVLETMSGRGSLYQIFRREEIVRRLDALIASLNGSAQIIDSIELAAKNNIVNPRKSLFPQSRFQLATLELLHTNRYLDIENSSYVQVDLLLLQLSTCNDHLNLWETHRKPINDWMLNTFLKPGKFSKITVKDILLRVLQQLESHRRTLTSQP